MNRKGNFKELVYTRCGPAYSIRGAELPGNNGYAIFNSTEGLWAQASDGDLQFAERMIVRQFQWSYGCPVKRSYSYLLLPHGEEGVFTDLYAYTEEDGANNSEQSNMRGSHLAQMLSGLMTMYPYELINSPYFSSRQQASTDVYYLERCAARLPEIPQESLSAGPITQRRIQEFLAGRDQIVQACAAWIIEQMDKPANARRPIIILDDAINIPVWIAAITNCFPVSMARKIPFFTCREGLEKPNSAAFYRVNKDSEEFVAQVNIQDPTQESRPLAMLLGCAREDATAARQVATINADASCVLLNGTEKTINFTPNTAIMNSGFIQQIATNPGFHAAAVAMLDDLEHVAFSSDFLPVYDAVSALTAKAHPTLKNLRDGLKALHPYADAKHTAVRRVLNALIEQKDYLNDYVNQDAADHYQLLSEMISYTNGCHEYSEAMQKLGTDSMRNALKEANAGLPVLWERIQANDRIKQAVLSTLIGHECFSFVSTGTIQQMSEGNCIVMIRMQDAYVKIQPEVTWKAVIARPDAAMQMVIQRSVYSKALLHCLCECIRDDKQALEIYIMGGAATTGNTPEKRNNWWISMQEEGCSADFLMRTVYQSKLFSARDLEQILMTIVSGDGYTPEVQQLYKQYLANEQDCGKAVIDDAIAYTLEHNDTNQANALDRLWATASSDVQASDLTWRLLNAVDREITMSESARNDALTQFIISHVRESGKYNAHAYQFLKNMAVKPTQSVFLRHQTDVIIKQWQKANPDFSVQKMDHDLTTAQLGKALLDKLTENAEELAAPLLLIGGFHFSDNRHFVAWMDAYIDALIIERFTAKDGSLATMIALKTLVGTPGKLARSELREPVAVIGKSMGSDQFVVRNMEYLIHRYVIRLSKEKKTASYQERWIKECTEKHGERVAVMLSRELNQAVMEYQKNNKDTGNIFSRLFKL